MKAMRTSKLKLAAVLLLAVMMAGLGALAVARAGAPREPGAVPAAAGKGGPAVKPRPPALADDLAALARKMNVIKDRLGRAQGGPQTQKLQKEVLAGLAELVQKLEARRKKGEEIDKESAEEKLERFLADLENRCRVVLARQVEVRDGTVALDKLVQASSDKKPGKAHREQAKKLAGLEARGIEGVEAARKLLEANRGAPNLILRQMVRDMKMIQDRLNRADTGAVTVSIENDVIATLRDVVAAIRKALKEATARVEEKPGRRRIDRLAELKMLHALQRRVNLRTELHGKGYKGEEVPAPETAKEARERERLEALRRELKALAERQGRIASIAHAAAARKE